MVRFNYPFYWFVIICSLISVPAQAGDKKDIAQCFDAYGDITYSDFLCATFENENPLLMGDDAIQQNIRHKQVVTNTAGTISPTELSSITDQAITHCKEQFARYFKRRHRAATEVPAIEFNQITDQYKKGTNISVSALGSIQYEENAASRATYVECTAQKLHDNSDWQIGFMEK